MAAPVKRTGAGKILHRPPPKVFLGVGAACLLVNHLSVAFGNGAMPEALAMASWLILIGGWVLLAGRSFDAVWAWADPSGARMIGLTLLTLVAALGLAEAIAWFAYGQHLVG